MKYIKNITISSDEVYHYEWLNSTDFCITLLKNEITKQQQFLTLMTALFVVYFKKIKNYKVKFFVGEDYIKIDCSGIADNSLITKCLIEACDYFLVKELTFKDSIESTRDYYFKHISDIHEFLNEIKEFIAAKKQKYYSRFVDGFN